MSLKTKALIQTAGMIALAVLTAATINFIMANVSGETILNALGLAIMGWIVYIFYSIRLSALQYEEKLREIASDKKVAE